MIHNYFLLSEKTSHILKPKNFTGQFSLINDNNFTKNKQITV